MPILHTEFGHAVLTELGQYHLLALAIFGDNQALNDRLKREDEVRKASALASAQSLINKLGSGQNAEDILVVEGYGEPKNVAYTAALERFANQSFVSRSIDLYHWYLRKVIHLALRGDPTLIRVWAPVLEISAKKAAEIEQAGASDEVINRLFPRRENVFRNLVHEHIGIPDLHVIPLMVEVRNCIVHHLGKDIEGKTLLLSEKYPELGIEVSSGQIIVSTSSAMEIVRRISADISIIDRIAAKTFDLPGTDKPMTSLSRDYGCGI